jgi:putative flavoprotein involved in K+ transport
MNNKYRVERVHTIVIGGGQAGLSVGYYLAKRGVSFLILDANQRLGDAWRNRWDSLRLFTPSRYVRLPGFPYQSRGEPFPTKDEMADYVEAYAKHFRLPVQTGVKVERLSTHGDHFVVEAGELRYESDNVVIAMANYQAPKVPAFAKEVDRGIVQIHSHHYKNPSQLQDGPVLVVGVGNSGADIGMEVARTHPTFISGTESGHIPFKIDTLLARLLFFRLVKFVGHHVLSLRTPIGRKARPKMLRQAAPLVRVKPQDLIDAGVKRVGRVNGVKDGQPLLEDGSRVEVKNIIWCTGYEHGFPWVDLPIFDENGEPKHERGVAKDVPGLYFVGLHFLYAMSSATVIGIGRDARHIVDAVMARPAARESTEWMLRPARVG